MHPLKSGQSYSEDWRHINRVAGQGAFVSRETIGLRTAQNERNRQLRTPVAGSIRGEYDPTLSYQSGDLFTISRMITVAGITPALGLYGVIPAGTDVLGNSFYGFVPANPTGNAVPQDPLPAIGAAPNDKFYSQLIVAFCPAT